MTTFRKRLLNQLLFSAVCFSTSNLLHASEIDAQDWSQFDGSDTSFGQIIVLKSPSLAQRYVAFEKNIGHAPSRDIQQMWQQEIQAEQAQLIANLGADVTITAQLSKAINAIKVLDDSKSVYDLVQSQLVHSVSEQKLHHMNLAFSVPWSGAALLHQHGITGEGMRIGIIDSGVDYMHTSLGGDGTGYETNDPNVVEPGSFPNTVVVGGIDLVGDVFDPRSENPEHRVPKPDGDPINFGGNHGTHVAAIAAGRSSTGFGSGVASGADIYAIKISAAGGGPVTSVAEEAMEYVLDPNGDFDLSDRLDVINMSFGRGFGSEDDPWTIAVQAVTDMGVIAIGAAGNNGPIPYIAGSPSIASGAISVAAATSGNIPFVPMTFEAADGTQFSLTATLPAIEQTLADNISGALIRHPNRSCEVSPSYENAIVMVDDRQLFCDKTQFSEQLKQIGAQALIVNSPRQSLSGNVSNADNRVPIFVLRQRPSNAADTVTIRVSDTFFARDPEELAGFSSQGPYHGAFKPEIAAPGVNIVAANAISGSGHITFSGTSMASPHVAGAMALLKSQYPDWDINALKALLMNYAAPLHDSTGELYPISRQGMGEMNISASLAGEFVAFPAGHNFGLLSLNAFTNQETQVSVRNLSSVSQHVDIDAQTISGIPGIKISHPKRIWLEAGETRQITVKIGFNPFLMQNALEAEFNEFGAYLTMTPQTQGAPFRVGLQAVVDPVTTVTFTDGQEGIVTLSNRSNVGTHVTALIPLTVQDHGRSLPSPQVAGNISSTEDGLQMQLGFVANQALPFPHELNMDMFVFTDNPSLPDFQISLGLDQAGYLLKVEDFLTGEIVFSEPVERAFDSKTTLLTLPVPEILQGKLATILLFSSERGTAFSRGLFQIPLVDSGVTLPADTELNAWKNLDVQTIGLPLLWFLSHSSIDQQAQLR